CSPRAYGCSTCTGRHVTPSSDRSGMLVTTPADPMSPRMFTVTGKRQDTQDTWTLWLEPDDGVHLQFGAGQFTMLQAFGAGEVPISISGDPSTSGSLQHTIRDVGGATRALVAAEPGEVMGVRGAFGH